jgi:hypothetical protein
MGSCISNYLSERAAERAEVSFTRARDVASARLTKLDQQIQENQSNNVRIKKAYQNCKQPQQKAMLKEQFSAVVSTGKLLLQHYAQTIRYREALDGSQLHLDQAIGANQILAHNTRAMSGSSMPNPDRTEEMRERREEAVAQVNEVQTGATPTSPPSLSDEDSNVTDIDIDAMLADTTSDEQSFEQTNNDDNGFMEQIQMMPHPPTRSLLPSSSSSLSTPSRFVIPPTHMYRKIS